MSYYTERHGMRNSVEKTYTINTDMYAVLFDCCERYHNNIAWRYPEECPDGAGCCGLDLEKLNAALKFEIPTLYRRYERIAKPNSNSYDAEQYDQYALLDYIEFIAVNCRDFTMGRYHEFYHHYHFTFSPIRVQPFPQKTQSFHDFQNEINEFFEKAGLLYRLTDSKEIERIVEDTPLTPELESKINRIQEPGVRELLREAIDFYKKPNPNARQYAIEKIWDAFERLKTYYASMDKKSSAEKIISDISGSNPAFMELLNKEFRDLTQIGNNFRIRHHETNKVDITDSLHYDYLFNRCLSLISLVINYLVPKKVKEEYDELPF